MHQAIQLFSDSNRGVYIPKHFAEEVNHEYVQGIDVSLLDDLIAMSANGDDGYWDVWAQVLDNCKIVIDNQTFHLHQDGDLWLVDYDNATPDELRNLLGDDYE